MLLCTWPVTSDAVVTAPPLQTKPSTVKHRFLGWLGVHLPAENEGLLANASRKVSRIVPALARLGLQRLCL